MAYPFRPSPKRRSSASDKGVGGKKKTWLSARIKVDNGRDVSPRLNSRWYDAPMYKDARVKRWAK